MMSNRVNLFDLNVCPLVMEVFALGKTMAPPVTPQMDSKFRIDPLLVFVRYTLARRHDVSSSWVNKYL